MSCSHDGIHDAVTRFDRDSGELAYTRICEACGDHLDVILREGYSPTFDAHGNDRYLSPQLMERKAA